MNKYILLLFGILFLNLVYAITITQLTPTDSPHITSNSSQLISFNFTNDNLQNLTFSWDNQNYSLYDSSLVLFYNFDNRSALGENATHVKDLSMYGNNGTVVGGSNISWTPNGKYGGAFNFTNSSYIRTGLTNGLNNSAWTISLWIKNKDSICGSQESIFGKNYVYWIYVDNNCRVVMQSKNVSGTDKAIDVSTINYLSNTNWHNLIYTYNLSNNMSYGYFDGSLFANVSLELTQETTSNINIGGDVNGAYWNGLIDDVSIYNRSVSLNEVKQVYYSSLTKYDNQNWTYINNQTLNYSTSYKINASNPTYNYDYSLCSSNLTKQICSSNQVITQNIPTTTLTTNFTSSIGIVDSNFYGVNLNTPEGGEDSYIDLDGNGTLDTLSNYQWNRQELLNTNQNFFRFTALMDTANSDGSFRDYTFDNYNNIRTRRSIVKWAYEHNAKVLLIIANVPTWLQNSTDSRCINKAYCPPADSNITRYNQVITDYIYNVSTNGLYNSSIVIEFWNEPYGGSFLDNLSTDNIQKSIAYNKFFNTTRLGIKAIYPNMLVGGPVGYLNTGKNITFGFMSNFTDTDFIDMHEDRFPITMSAYDRYSSFLDNMSYYNTLYGLTSNKLILSELTLAESITMKNTSSLANQYSNQIAQAYLVFLNKKPSNTSLFFFKWSSEYSYRNISIYPEYPSLFSMVSQEGLDNPTPTYYPPYNVTKNFATLCPAGATVYQSSSDDDTLKTVTCKDGNKYNLIIINTDTSSKNVSVNGMSIAKTRLKDSNTGVIYAQNSNLGVIDSYEIKYLTSETCEYKLEDNGINCSCASNEILNDDGITCNTLTEDSNICSALPDGLSNVAGFFGALILIGMIILVISVVGMLLIVFKGGSDGIGGVDFKVILFIIMGIGGLIVSSIIAMFISQLMCSIQ